MEDKDMIIERLQKEIEMLVQISQEAIENRQKDTPSFDEFMRDIFGVKAEQDEEDEQTEASMKDANGEDLESEREDSSISTDDRIMDTYNQLVNTAIDRLNKAHTDTQIDEFIKITMTREQWLDKQSALRLQE